MVFSQADGQVRVAAEGAQNFIDYFYQALTDRKPLLPFYINSSSRYTSAAGDSGSPSAADISINGTVLPTPADLEQLLERQARGSRVKYDVDSFDVQILNPAYRVACPPQLEGDAASNGRGGRGGVSGGRGGGGDQRVSLLCQVTGHVTYGPGRDAHRSAFAESFVLVPNWDAIGPKAARGLKGWLIQSQTFKGL